jgi:hypothetical protein
VLLFLGGPAVGVVVAGAVALLLRARSAPATRS